MKNKEILKFLKLELESFTNYYGEIKEPKDYINFIKTLNNLSVSLKNQELGNPLGISISDIIKDKEETKKVLVNLYNIKNIF